MALEDIPGTEVDWAEPYPEGRFGLVMGGAGVMCDEKDYPDAMTAGGGTPSVLFQYNDGRVVHYRCVPDEIKHRYGVTHQRYAWCTYRGEEIDHWAYEEAAYPWIDYRPQRAVVNGDDAIWLFKGSRHHGLSREDEEAGWGIACVTWNPIRWGTPDQGRLL